MESQITIIAVIASVATLLGYLMKLTFNWTFRKLDEKDTYIAELVEHSEKRTGEFVATVNHHQSKMNISIDKLTSSIEAQSEIFKQLIKK